MVDEMWDPYDRNCPTRTLLDRIADRWAVLVVGALDDGPLRYSELVQRVDGVSQKMLTQTLRGLERDGLLTRTMYPEIPPRVEYELTAAGKTLLPSVRGLAEWTKTHMSTVLSARERYDAVSR